ncbi:hypothetical protein D5S18_22565 [Nocardia panacis]|uniref:Phospholipase/carboxylesterase/thioesterase domain-containing protein n=1 Tax=Nocardia panacis TaxID=2340916 RepID=A0A3A4JSD3_9NOCA|nr:alpha/beta fold hydrolase [Nocardia panacis]RJO72554.1 hypothetical protein D5S18_22565 [Nocardia panacis]
MDPVVVRGSLGCGAERRTYTVVRSRWVAEAAPLVLVLHGFRDTADSIRRYSGGSFDALTTAGAMVVYPNGVAREWNSARRAVMLSRRVKRVDDVGFLRELIRHLVSELAVDVGRVFVVGFSLGGQMAIRLVCDAPGLVAGAALISSTLPAPGNRAFNESRSAGVPILAFHGTADPLAPWGGGTVGFRCSPTQRRVLFGKGPHLSAPDTLRWFAVRNGIESPPTFAWIRTARGWVGRTDYREEGCAPVTGYTIVGGRHEIPGPRPRLLRPDATVGGGLVAASVVSDYFGLGK